jgi:2-polyprenyl-3-methyl-5-hydroxy-6-metoxy-1,4-benzoquinol methylase
MVCRECHGGFAWPRPEAAHFEQIYDPAYVERYAASVMHGRELSRWRFVQFTRHLKGLGWTPPAAVPGRILDVGCAGGSLLMEFKNEGWQVQGTDVSPVFAELAQSRGIPVAVGDALSVNLPADHYDLVTMSHVIEHLVNPMQVLAGCARSLRDGGVLAIETPNWKGAGALVRGPRWSHIIPPEHLNYFGPTALRRIALRAGFARSSTATTTPPFLEGLDRMPASLRRVARLTYRVAARLGAGTTLLGFAWKGSPPHGSGSSKR